MNESNIEVLGCDLGDKTSACYLLGRDGKGKKLEAIRTTRDCFREFFRHREPLHVVIEVGTHSRWVSLLLKKLGHTVTVANARRVQLISKNSLKCDENDAELLARLGRADLKLLSPVEHRSDAAQADLAIVKARDALVSSRTKLVNHVRSTVKSFGERLPACDAKYFVAKTQEHLPAELKDALAPVYSTIELLTAQIKQYDRTLEKLAKKYPEANHLASVVGVGPITALAFVLTIEDPKRFKKSRMVGAYLGLRTKRSQSGGSDPRLRITKEGDPLLRRLLVNCAANVMRRTSADSDLRRWALRLAQRGGKAPVKRAQVALARKLAVLLHRLWVTGEQYQPFYKEASNAKAA